MWFCSFIKGSLVHCKAGISSASFHWQQETKQGTAQRKHGWPPKEPREAHPGCSSTEQVPHLDLTMLTWPLHGPGPAGLLHTRGWPITVDRNSTHRGSTALWKAVMNTDRPSPNINIIGCYWDRRSPAQTNFFN